MNYYFHPHAIAKAIGKGVIRVTDGIVAVDANAPYDRLEVLRRAGALHRVQRGVYIPEEQTIKAAATGTIEEWAAMDSPFFDEIIVSRHVEEFRASELAEWTYRTKQAVHHWLRQAEEAGIIESIERGYRVTDRANELIANATIFFKP